MKTGIFAIALCICAFLAPDLYFKIEKEFKDKESKVPNVKVINKYIEKPIKTDSGYIKLDSTFQIAEDNKGWIYNVIKKANQDD